MHVIILLESNASAHRVLFCPEPDGQGMQAHDTILDTSATTLTEVWALNELLLLVVASSCTVTHSCLRTWIGHLPLPDSPHEGPNDIQ